MMRRRKRSISGPDCVRCDSPAASHSRLEKPAWREAFSTTSKREGE
jgi:hypothetical protein